LISRVEETGEEEEYSLNSNIHYHSTQILLSLLAPVVPSFAEECWLALHYGRDEWRDKGSDDEDDDYDRNIPKEWIFDELAELEYQNLPRRNDPSTLSSIFSQPFPIPEDSEDLEELADDDDDDDEDER